jgi:hypothetical protein
MENVFGHLQEIRDMTKTKAARLETRRYYGMKVALQTLQKVQLQLQLQLHKKRQKKPKKGEKVKIQYCHRESYHLQDYRNMFRMILRLKILRWIKFLHRN